MPPILRLDHVTFAYPPPPGGEPPRPALDDVSLAVAAGEYVVVLGHNGSGKSTLAKHLNALLLPGLGDVYVQEWNTRDAAHTLDIRRTVGMVFQHPDNQIVATIVEEDVAFGPENLGVPRPELLQRVDWALDLVEMQAFRGRGPHQLSGGQKQRVCIAGVLAMQPQVLVLDEATAMLDPLGRAEVLAVARRLNREQGVTVVAVTHFMAEALDADRVVVMAGGRVALEGSPRAVFRAGARLAELQLDLPPVTALAAALHARVPAIPPDLLRSEELTAAIARVMRGGSTTESAEERAGGTTGWSAGEIAAKSAGDGTEESTARSARESTAKSTEGSTGASAEESTAKSAKESTAASNGESTAGGAGGGEALITVRDLTYFYMRGTPLEVQALAGVSFGVRAGEILGVLGHTGSGKSTAIQHLNGLLRPHGGEVSVLGYDLRDPQVDVRAVRRRVGLVFQLPEAQLFEQYVGDDVAYGPRKLNLSREEVRARVRRAMEAVGLGFEEFKDRLTFRLSGGQMRRVALAGVLALEPQVLVLDEPTAGLDPQARRQLMAHILALRERGMTLVIISHNMEEMAAVCDRLVVIAEGRTVMEGTPEAVFGRGAELRALGLGVPLVTEMIGELAAAGLLPPETPTVTTVDEAVEVLAEVLLGVLLEPGRGL